MRTILQKVAAPTRRATALAAAATLGLALSACAPSSDGDDSAEGSSAVDVAVIYSETGPLAAYGAAYRAGLEAGLDYATDGTGEVDGQAIELSFSDDAGDSAKAVSLAKDAIGSGTQIVVGTVSSGVALPLAEQAEQNKILYISGPAAADAITGINDYTFRSGRQTYQDVATAGALLGDPSGQKVVVFGQDNAFGQGNAAAVDAVLGAAGADVQSVLVPEDATEFTPFARRILDAKPDLVFVAWAGDTTAAMWQSLSQQQVFDAAPVTTGLADVASYNAYGAASDQITFLSHYFADGPDNEVNDAMVASLEEAGETPDLFSPDGFVAGQMIAHAVAEGGGDVDAMVAALEGWTFDGPKGETTVRAEDHALIQPMYAASLVADGDGWTPELVEEIDADTVAPPVAGE
ncbi:substrate-binding domain-containing protein [Nocardioides bruguierae]|uniref:Substrate-binding domain-containing protein n=1 Tax=Nocardioides bruguierae TaxID=2945102 RepID=A0A9X2ID86_9ACTN|nr:substrate-binding domain-containing protein [Nocardioides bruguierae]MCM0619012.1 substrate-binding domain-containing protein [Nocardioides bruguierae]